MNTDFFSILGSLASIGGIPLAIYLFIKSREDKFIRVKKEIVKILSYQIGENRNLRVFEIETVINSKIRENHLKKSGISISEIIEDLVAETIASPLLDSSRKEIILDNFKKLYYKGEIFDTIDKFEAENMAYLSEIELDRQLEGIENEIKDLAKQNILVENKHSKKRNNENQFIGRFSNIFGLATVGISAFATLLLSLIEDNTKLALPFVEFIEKNQYIGYLSLGAILSIVTLVITLLMKYFISYIEKRFDETQ